MEKFEFPSHAELRVIEDRAHKMRAQAIHDGSRNFFRALAGAPVAIAQRLRRVAHI